MRRTVLLIRCMKLSCIFVLADDAEGDVGTAGVDLARYGLDVAYAALKLYDLPLRAWLGKLGKR